MPAAKVNILAVIGSPRADAVSASFVKAVLAEAATHGATVRELDLRGQCLADLAGPRDSQVSGFMARMHLD